uniref:Uncharacterized protein n=1 Tax=Acrobeloides nanus TaxID=290746 RepID=A0A914CV94_9BILA
MKVSDIKMALDVKMTMRFTNDFWETCDESPINCEPKFIDTIKFEVEIPEKILQKGNIDFRVCSKISSSINSTKEVLQ